MPDTPLDVEQNIHTIADLLEMEPSAIEQFVDYHPNPSIDVLIAATDAELDGQEREQVAAWLTQHIDAGEDSSPASSDHDVAGLRGLWQD